MLDRVAVGEMPAKHHIALRAPDGALRWEECITREGFDGPYTITYHERRPHEARTAGAARHGWPAPEEAPQGELRRRHFRTPELPRRGGPPIDTRRPLLFNSDVVIGISRPDVEDPVYFSDADGDELVFVMEGGGVLRTALGDVRFDRHDYVYVPRGLLHRWIPDEGLDQYWLTFECPGGVSLLKQWRNATGQLRMDAPYCHRDFRRPDFRGPLDEGIREQVVKRGGRFHAMTWEHSPLDVVGWDGTVYPWAFPILCFQPRAGLVHLPPTWHGTFATRNGLICSFVPRVVDFHPEAIPCPYPHASVDCDEMLFYVEGNFTSRKGVGPGSMSYHPMGIPHGPHPGAYEASIGTTRTDELAVMMDTFEPLRPTVAASEVEDDAYHESFVG